MTSIIIPDKLALSIQGNIKMREKLDLLKRLYSNISKGEWKLWVNHWGKADIAYNLDREATDDDNLINGNPVEYIGSEMKPDDAWFITEFVKVFPDIISHIESLRNIETEYDIKLTKIRKALDKAGVKDLEYVEQHNCDRCLSLEERINCLIKDRDELEYFLWKEYN